jgi:WD40 repeat protein
VNPSAIPMPAEMAISEEGPEGGGIAILTTSTKQIEYLTRLGNPAGSMVWSPDGRWLAISESGQVSLLNIHTRERHVVTGGAARGMPCSRCFSGDGRYLATLLPGKIMLTEVAGVSHTLDLQESARPVELAWSDDNRRLAVLARSPSDGNRLLWVDVASQRIVADDPTRCRHLLGWRQGKLLVDWAGAGGSQVGSVSRTLGFQILRTEGIVEDERSLEYLPATDRLVLTIARGHSGDPMELFISAPGLNGASRWLPKVSYAGEMRFSRDGHWMVFIDRSREGLLEGNGGDLYLCGVGSDQPVLLRRASEETTYIVGAPRP